MIRNSFQNSGFAGATSTHCAGIIRIDPRVEQCPQDGLFWRNRDCAATTLKLNFESILHACDPLSRSLAASVRSIRSNHMRVLPPGAIGSALRGIPREGPAFDPNDQVPEGERSIARGPARATN